MRILLIDNTKEDKVHFTRMLEERLYHLIGKPHVVRCSTVDQVVDRIENDKLVFDAAILSGSTLNLSQPNRIEHMRKSLSALLRLPGVPILGICFGMQLIAMAYGGLVRRLDEAYDGDVTIRVEEDSLLFHGRPCNAVVTLSHQDFVDKAPPDFKVFSVFDNCVQVLESLRFLRFGVQFHPENSPLEARPSVLRNFCHFVHERKTIPKPLRAVDERVRVKLCLSIIKTGNLRRTLYETDCAESIDLILAIWCHHLRSWKIESHHAAQWCSDQFLRENNRCKNEI